MSDILLFSPLTIRGIELRNRIVVPPMHQYSAMKGYPTDWHLMNAGKFAAGGAGLVVVESTKVERRGCGTLDGVGRQHRHCKCSEAIQLTAQRSRDCFVANAPRNDEKGGPQAAFSFSQVIPSLAHMAPAVATEIGA